MAQSLTQCWTSAPCLKKQKSISICKKEWRESSISFIMVSETGCLAVGNKTMGSLSHSLAWSGVFGSHTSMLLCKATSGGVSLCRSDFTGLRILGVEAAEPPSVSVLICVEVTSFRSCREAATRGSAAAAAESL